MLKQMLRKKRLISCLIIAPRAAPCLPPAHESHRPERTPPVWPRAGAREGEGERGQGARAAPWKVLRPQTGAFALPLALRPASALCAATRRAWAVCVAGGGGGGSGRGAGTASRRESGRPTLPAPFPSLLPRGGGHAPRRVRPPRGHDTSRVAAPVPRRPQRAALLARRTEGRLRGRLFCRP